MVEVRYGSTEPRIWTKPLRELTPETSLGFEVIKFAKRALHIDLRPWQQWLLIHALELREDGSYRFQKVLVLVARQNGKTLLASVLAAWWLFMDPKRIPPVKFKVVGVAQNLDIAREPWVGVKSWCDPDPETDEERDLAIPALQAATAKVFDTNGKESIFARSRAHYEIRAAANARGKPAPRVLMDEVREQKNWTAWNAVSHTLKSFGRWGQMWGFSNAGDVSAVVLKAQRELGMAAIAEWEQYVEAGLMSAEEFANGNDVSFALFEWSAPDGCALDDVEAVLQANPSIGYGEMTVQDVMAAAPPGSPEADYRTEALCQWVTAKVEPHVEPESWRQLLDPESEIAEGSPLVLGVDVSWDRKWSYIAVAGWRADGLKHAELVAQRPGSAWVRKAAAELRDRWGIDYCAVQVRGCPASELIPDLVEAGFEIVEVGGSTLGAVPGRFADDVRDRRIRHRGQPAMSMSLEGAMTKQLNEVRVWDRVGSGTDASPAVALSEASWALDPLPEEVEAPPPPVVGVLEPVVSGADAGLVDLSKVAF